MRGLEEGIVKFAIGGLPGLGRQSVPAHLAERTESSVAVREIVTSPELGSVIGREDAEGLVAALDHWLAPGRVRPEPVISGGDPVAEYLALFDSLVQAKAQP